MKIFPEGKAGKIFGIIFTIGLIFLVIEIVLSNYMPPNCNPMDYPYGSEQWRQCLLTKAEVAKSGYNTLADCTEGVKTMCYKEVAIKTNNLSICDLLAELDYTSDMEISLCFSNVGIKNNNIQGCERASSTLDKEYCYSQIAMQTRNKALCENIRPGNYRDYCIQQAG